MKVLQDAIAANETSERLRILKTIPAKEYPRLLKVVEETRQVFQLEMSATYQAEKDAQDAMREAVYRKIDCLDLVEMMASLTKKKIQRQPGDHVLLDHDVIDLLAKTPPAWLPKLIHGRSTNIILRYLEADAIPSPPVGHSYYADLTEFVMIQSAGKTDRVKSFLMQNRGIVERDLAFIIHQMAIKRKGSPNLLSIPHYSWGLPRADEDQSWTHRYFDKEDGGIYKRVEMSGPFSLMRTVGLLCSERVFEIQPILRSIHEALSDVQREDEARGVINAHEKLATAPQQSLKLQHDYFTLLSSPHKAVARFSINTIAGFVALKGFDAQAFVSLADVIFCHVSNPLQIAGLKLIRDVTTHHPKIAKQIPEKIASALLNPDPKVQAGILAVLEALPPVAQKAIPAALLPFADRVIPSLRSAFEKWIGELRELSIPNQSSAIELQPVCGDRLLPLTSADELPFLASEILSGQADPMRFELFLDALARFAATDRQKLATVFGSVEARARHGVVEGGKNGYHPSCLESLTSRLILHFGPNPAILGAVSQNFGPPPDTSVWPAAVGETGSVWGFAHSRVAELVFAVDSGRASRRFAHQSSHLASSAAILSGCGFGHWSIKDLSRCISISSRPSPAVIRSATKFQTAQMRRRASSAID